MKGKMGGRLELEFSHAVHEKPPDSSVQSPIAVYPIILNLQNK